MADSALRRWLGTPRGHLQLIALTFAVATLLACVAASQRARFERAMIEKYPPVTPTTGALAQRLGQAGATREEAARLAPEQLRLLYQAWLMAEVPEAEGPWPRLPEVIAAADPVLADELVARTLVAGSPGQRHAALRFAVTSGSAALVPALELGLRRAVQQRAPPPRVAELEAALTRLRASPTP